MRVCRELTETVETNMQLRKQVSELTNQIQQQVGVNKVCMEAGNSLHGSKVETNCFIVIVFFYYSTGIQNCHP